MALGRIARVLLAAATTSLLASHVLAETGFLTNGLGDGFKCAGVYGSRSERQGRRSAIEIVIPPVPPSDIAIAVFDYPDSRWIGIPVKEGTKLPDEKVGLPSSYINGDPYSESAGVHRFTVCNNETMTMGLCTETDRGRPLINDRDNNGKPRLFSSIIYSDYVMLNRSGPGYTRLERNKWLSAHNKSDDHSDQWWSKPRSTSLEGATLEWLPDGTLKIRYLVNTTGYFCVDAASLRDFTARAEWINSYGLLPASEYPKMYIYLVLAIAYSGIAIAWAFMSWRVWAEILPVQNQLLGLVCLLAVDMGMNFGFWKHYNSTGAPSMVYSVFTLVIDAGRNSLSFFMLLVVAL
ncbi:hypothetical protein GGH91_004924, partial [Coemansia sp. RSA 2671]